jgi:hypothetical protein
MCLPGFRDLLMGFNKKIEMGTQCHIPVRTLIYECNIWQRLLLIETQTELRRPRHELERLEQCQVARKMTRCIWVAKL